MIKWLKSQLLDPDFKRGRNFLQRVPLFRGLSRRDMGRLLHALIGRNYQAGETLCGQGDMGRTLFLIETGEVEVLRQGPDGHPIRLAVLKEGDYFGEISLIDEQHHSATVVALCQTRVYLLNRNELEKLIRHAPRIGATIMAHLAALLAARVRASLSQSPLPLYLVGQPKSPVKAVLAPGE